MKFTLSHTTEGLDVLREVSESGRWELGVWRVLYGYRIRAGVVDNGVFAVDYCTGSDMNHVSEVLGLVRVILSSLPEDVEGDEVHALMPGFQVKPIHNDKACVPRLMALAARANAGEDLLGREAV